MIDNARILIVEARFYEDIADELARGAIAELEQARVDYERISVPGAFEIPAAIRFAIRSMEVHSSSSGYSGFVALGCVIRGETDHYDHICRESARGLSNLAMTYSVAIGNGILTCENGEQAWARARVDQKNKGADAAKACLRMIELKRSFRLLLR